LVELVYREKKKKKFFGKAKKAVENSEKKNFWNS